LLWDEQFREQSEKTNLWWGNMNEEKQGALQEKFVSSLVPAKTKKEKKTKVSTIDETKRMIAEGKTLKEIARLRALTYGTIMTHAEKIKSIDPMFDISALKKEITQKKLLTIIRTLRSVGMEGGEYRLTPAKEILGNDYSFDDIRLGRLLMK